MSKPKRVAPKTKTQKKSSPPQKSTRPSARKKPSRSQKYSSEYREYLDRYQFMADGRPRLSPTEFDKLDDELLDLLALDQLNDDQAVRKQELEYLLLDPES